MNNNIEEIKKIKMTDAEKAAMLERVMSSGAEIPAKGKSVLSPYQAYIFISNLSKNRLVAYAILPLFVLVVGGSAVLASGNSLPGNILYPFKVNVVEPVRGALTFSTENKAKYEVSLANERLEEAETLTTEGKMDDVKENNLNTLLVEHTAALNKNLDKLRKEKSHQDNTVDDIATSFQSGMDAHANALDVINKDRGASKKDDDKDSSDEDTKLSKTARQNAAEVNGNFRNMKGGIFMKGGFGSKNNDDNSGRGSGDSSGDGEKKGN